MKKQVSYQELDHCLQELGAQISPAETHGLLTGIICLLNDNQDAIWRATLLESLDCEQPNKRQWKILDRIVDSMRAKFIKLNFDFDLMLPSDETPLNERVLELGHWCRGFLSGLGMVGITSEDLKNEVVKELVDDLSKIAHVSMGKKASEEDEDNFIEIVEYVRMAVQNIQLELKKVDEQPILH